MNSRKSRRIRFLGVCVASILAAALPAQRGKDKPGNPPPDPAIVFVAVASRGGTNELMVADADGRNATTLLSSPYEGFFFPSWSPDLHPETAGFQGSVVYEYWSGPLSAPVIDLYTVDVVVGASGVQAANNRLLLDDAFLPAWSPQGDKIAYVGNHDDPEGIYVLDLDDGISTLVCENIDWNPPTREYQAASWPAWSPDGTTLAFAFEYWDDVAGTVHQEIRTKVIIDGTETVAIDESGTSIDWSRDGNFLAYKRGGELRVVDLTTTPPRNPQSLPLTQWADQPTWPPPDRSSELAFMSRRGTSGSGKRKIVLRDLTTQVETDLISRKGWHLYEPDWRREQ